MSEVGKVEYAPDYKSGLTIIPNWDQHLEEQKDAALRRSEAICRDHGHDWHTCPSCADRSCLRCGLGESA